MALRTDLERGFRSIGARLALAFSCVIVFLVAQGLIANYLTKSLSLLQRQVMDQELHVQRLQGDLAKVRLTVYKLLGTLDPSEMDFFRDTLHKLTPTIIDQLGALGIEPQMVSENFQLYRDIISLHYDFSLKTARARINGPSQAVHDALMKRLEAVYQQLRQQNLAKVTQARRRADFIYLALLIAALAVATLWAAALARSLTDRRRASEALTQSETHLRTLVESSFDGIVTADENRKITSCNQAFAAMYGHEAPWLIGRSTQVIFPSLASYEEFGRLAFPSLEKQGHWQGEWTFQGRDGNLVDIELVVSAQRGPDGRMVGTVGVHRDISLRKQAEQRIKKERDRAQKYLDIAGVIFIALDEKGRITLVNQKGLEILGYEQSHLLGQDWFTTCLPPEKQLLVREMYQELMDGRRDLREHLVSQVVTKDGRKRVIAWHNSLLRDGQGRLSGALSSGEDITEQKKAEEELQQIFSLSLDLICIADIETATFLKVNPAFTHTLGYSEEELLGRSFLEFIHQDDVEPTRRVVEDRLRKGHKIFSFLNRYRCKNGDYVWLEWVSHPVPQQGITFAIAHDVTERKRAEATKEQLEIQLRHAQKLEAVGTLAGGIAHDFNNILAAIMGYTELALEKNKLQMSTSHEMEQVMASAERARDLVRNILAFSRKSDTELGPLDFNQVVRLAAHLLERTIPRMISIELRLMNGQALVRGDSAQLEQMVLNLCFNAKDAMPQGGRLIIATQEVFLSQEYCQANPEATPGPHVRLTVSDTGPGIPPEVMEHIFDPFFTTKKVGSGTGLGLSSVYGIVRGHQGHVICHSEPGQGATFEVNLPAMGSHAHGQVQALPQPSEQAPQGGHETILLVDDEANLREIGGMMLGQEGYRVLQAASGEEAVELFTGRSQEVDMVILDISMPGMGGHRCLEHLLKIKPEAKVLVASGYSKEGTIGDTLESGAAGFLAKPFQRSELLEKVRQILDA